MTHVNKKKTGKDDKGLERVLKLVEDKGRPAFETARKAIIGEKIQNKTVREALNYYMLNLWFDVHHAGLLCMACEAIGGNPNKTTLIGAATILLRGGIDIHDDIIDQQKTKTNKLTVYGKYGKNIAILVGNAFLFKGFALLSEAMSLFSREKREMITNLIKDAFFEIGDAVANEVEFRKNPNLPPEDYYVKVMKTKAVGVEVHMKVGAIAGGGTRKEIEGLARFGRILGIMATVRDEVIDMYEPKELRNRTKNEIPPLPILYAFKSQHAKEKIRNLLKKKRIRQIDAYEILDIAFKSKDYMKFRKDMKKMVETALTSINVENVEIGRAFIHLLELLIEDI